tara:strand:+ start:2315 stop:3163 length:849 start_codon:yes stop_codon:yes gene_type:complete
MKKINEKKKFCTTWFKSLRDQICKELEELDDGKFKFKRTKWYREKKGNQDLGGGEMSILRGNVFEKAGVNISTVFGSLSNELAGKIPGTEKSKKFWASGISVVIHPFSPKIPAIHMNTRFIITRKSWFGGGTDITPSDLGSKSSQKLAKFFHSELEKICEDYHKGSYKKFKKWCDDYFFLPHRQEHRGLGGIFYDNLCSNDWEADFNFTKKVGEIFLGAYKTIVKKSINLKWSESDKKIQLHRRSRYAEFNLLYDRGTKFGLQTNGNVEAIFMSLPPSTGWK